MLDQSSLELFAIAVVEDPFGLNSKQAVLRMGQPVTASIRGVVLKDVIKVPRNAVSQLNKVYVVDKQQQTLSQRTIEALWTDAQHMIIRDPGIQNGDWLATTRLVYAPEGSPVEIIPDAEQGEVLATAETKETSQR